MTFRQPLLTHIPSDIAAVSDYEAYARRRLDDNAWSYLHSAAADELSWGWNRAAFDRWQLLPRVLADVRGGHTRLSLSGTDLASPLLLAPVAHQGLFHPDAELATACAAEALATPMLVSTLASRRLEEIAAASAAPLWFQLYIQADRDFTHRLVQRAEAAAYQALVITVDAPVFGLRNREQRAGFHLPAGLAAANLAGMAAVPAPVLQVGQSAVFDGAMAAAPSWDDIARLQDTTRLPVWLKGIVHPDDARKALALGVAGIVVSNHGGRTLDSQPASIDALPAIAAAVAGRLPLLLDGGIRRGSDIFKALALGASAVLIGRPWVYALAAAGPLGVAHTIKLLQDELAVTMALCGCRTLADITPDFVLKERV